jgi:uncharacterized protein (DUF362 family)
MDSTGFDISEYYKKMLVSIHRTEPFYLEIPPFNPYYPYPEYKLLGETSSTPNPAYDSVRNCLRLLELDAKSFNKKEWNPFKNIVSPGYKVVIKPNFVASSHSAGRNLYSIITHPSVIRVIIDYVYTALEGEGEIIIADSPMMDCNFNELMERTKLPTIQEFYWKKRKFEIKILDLRDFWLDIKNGDVAQFVKRRKKLSGDPLGSVLVNLGGYSRLCEKVDFKNFCGPYYNRDETITHHHGTVHEYLISGSVLAADVVISVPKLKVHKKVGVTLNAKGMVGISTNKNFLVHYTLGTSEEGGDQFPPGVLNSRESMIIKIQRLLHDLLLSRKKALLDKLYEYIVLTYRMFLTKGIGRVSSEKRVFDGGNWYGNDTAWRMVCDLMTIIAYCDKAGVLREIPQRKIFSVVDGIIGGENNGPLSPDEKRAGIVIAGSDPLAVDIVGCRLMGFDWKKLKWATDLVENERFNCFVRDISSIKIRSWTDEFLNMFEKNDKLLDFLPHPGWRGYVELSEE